MTQHLEKATQKAGKIPWTERRTRENMEAKGNRGTTWKC